jgi:hypothetical protein
LGRGKGFARSEVNSIIGDDEITPVIAARVHELFNLFVETGDIVLPVAVNNVAVYLRTINELEKKVSERDFTLHLLESQVTKIKEEMKTCKSDLELDRQADYIIRECLTFKTAMSQLQTGDVWRITISPKPSYVEAFLLLMLIESPPKLRKKLLSRIDGSHNEVYYQEILAKAPRSQTFMEKVMDRDNQYVISIPDEYGEMVERIYKPGHFEHFSRESISFEDLKRLVEDTKDKMRNPDYFFDKWFETKYPRKIRARR